MKALTRIENLNDLKNLRKLLLDSSLDKDSFNLEILIIDYGSSLIDDLLSNDFVIEEYKNIVSNDVIHMDEIHMMLFNIPLKIKKLDMEENNEVSSIFSKCMNHIFS